MTYERVVQFRAKDGSLHDSEDLARIHDQFRRREASKARALARITDILSEKAFSFNRLPATWLDRAGKELPSQEELAEAIFDNWATIASAASQTEA